MTPKKEKENNVGIEGSLPIFTHPFAISEIGKSLIITEIGSTRDKIDIIMRNLKKLAEEPDAVHRLVGPSS